MTRICCPFDATPAAGGLVLSGSALVNVAADPYDGMVCVLPLDETAHGTTGEYVDRTRNHNDGTAGKILLAGEVLDTTTIPTIDDGVFCLPSQHFDGRQLIHIDQDNLTGNHEFTVSLWTKFETFYKSRTFYSRGFDDGAGNQYVVSFGHSFLNTLSISVHTVDPVAEILFFGSTTLAQNTWYHVAVSYSSNTIKLFVNGVLVGTKLLVGSLSELGNACFLATTDYSANIQGNIQELHLFPEAKSANYLMAEYHSFCDYFVTEGELEPLLYS